MKSKVYFTKNLSSESLINIYKNFNIDEWFKKKIYIDYENACSVSSEFESIEEEIYWILDEYKKINNIISVFSNIDLSNEKKKR